MINTTQVAKAYTYWHIAHINPLQYCTPRGFSRRDKVKNWAQLGHNTVLSTPYKTPTGRGIRRSGDS
jgi:hypothetical protein